MMETGNSPLSYDQLAREVRAIYQADRSRAETSIEDLLSERLQGIPPGERCAAVERLAREFQEAPSDERQGIGLEQFEQKELSQFLSLLLGRNITTADLSSEEVAERLVQSLNTVFDTLNKTIAVIHSTLMGRKGELETIRHIIGSDLAGARGSQSLQDYLDQIQEAFLVAHRGFQEASCSEIEKILVALDPERIAAEDDRSFRFGPFRKAEHYERYKEKYRAVKIWFESGRVREDLLRDFENLCGKEYRKKAEDIP